MRAAIMRGSGFRPFRIFGLLLTALLLAWSPAAQAKRVALIIANSAYVHGSSLFNPPFDAALVGEAAQQAGFEVMRADNLDQRAFLDALSRFNASAEGADVAMIYYAGHGAETAEGKFLIPTDAEIPTASYLALRAINVNLLLDSLGKAHNSVLVLDSGREGFAGDGRTAGFSNNIQRPNMLVLTSSPPGQTPVDGRRGEGSPFAVAFARWLPEPGLELATLPSRVAQDVSKATGGRQTPVASASLGEQVVLVPAGPVLDPGEEARDWVAAVQSNTAAAYQAFVDKWPNGTYRTLAFGSIIELGGTPRLPPKAGSDSTAGTSPGD